MSEQPRHEALVAAAILGVVKAEGWIEMPITVDVNRALDGVRSAGGVAAMKREHAVTFTRGLIERICEAEDLPTPRYSDNEERAIAILFGEAYDLLVEAERSA